MATSAGLALYQALQQPNRDKPLFRRRREECLNVIGRAAARIVHELFTRSNDLKVIV